MYRFNGMDGRLDRSLESVLLIVGSESAPFFVFFFLYCCAAKYHDNSMDGRRDMPLESVLFILKKVAKVLM
jgi:hypothetical protein